MKDRMRQTVARIREISEDMVAFTRGESRRPFMESLLDLRDVTIVEQEWTRGLEPTSDEAELVLQYRLLMAVLHIDVSEVIAQWPDDPEGSPPAKKLAVTMGILLRDFRGELDPPKLH